MESFTVCKIEAGRAVLLSQGDFELIEFPAKLLPKDCGIVKISVSASEAGKDEQEMERIRRLLREVEEAYGIGEREIERIKEEIGMEGFLRIENLGSTAAILSWPRAFSAIFGESIRIDNIILNVESEGKGQYYEEYVDFVLKGQKGIKADETKIRINLPIDLKVSLLVKSSAGCFRSNEIKLTTKKFEDFSGIFLLIDLVDQPSCDRLEFVRDQGGYISRSFCPDQPITAIISDSFESELFRIGIDNNLPVVCGTWLEALISTRELPQFEDHLIIKNKE